MPLDPGADLDLFLAPLRDVSAIESLLDLPIQLIQVDLVDVVLQLGVLGVQLLDGPAVEVSFLLLALPQRLPHPVEEGLGELKLPEDGRKLALQLLLSHVMTAAASLVKGAVVVDVAVLLDLRGDGAAAGGDGLGAVKQRLVDERRVLASVALTKSTRRRA